jgi:DNA-directed RNA polymerase I, II, and III subunit RPABC1
MEKAYQICTELFDQRGYTDIDTEETDQLSALEPSNGEMVYAFFVETLKFNIDCVQNYMSLMNTLDIKHCIIIYNDTITPSAKKAIKTNMDFDIELYRVNELQYNVTKHRLVPRHEQIHGEEYEFVQKKFGASLPKLFDNDPVARFYHFQKGNIIRVTRLNHSIAYRIVVSS